MAFIRAQVILFSNKWDAWVCPIKFHLTMAAILFV